LSENASVEFSKLLSAVQAKNYVAVKNLGDVFKKDYKNTPYALLASLELAKVAIIDKNMQEAEQQLLYIINKDKKAPLYHIAVLRLARLYRNNGEDDKALKLLDTNPDGFSALYSEIKGDIAIDKNDLSAAKKFYNQAQEEAPQSGATPWLQLKLENLSNIESNKDS
jgi:predicted negative regulator of RcsB-dependent stress response